MSQGGTVKEQLDKVTKELEVETDIWNRKGWAYTNYRMGHSELYVRCEVVAIYELIKDKLHISEDEFTLYLRRAVVKQLRELRKTQEAHESAELRKRLTDGITIIPPKDLKNGDL